MRRRCAPVALLGCCTLALLLAAPSSAHPADDAAAQAIASQLEDFGSGVFDQLGSLGALGDGIPLTGLTASSPEVLDLHQLMQKTLGPQLAGVVTLTDLEQAFANASGGYGSLDVDFAPLSGAPAIVDHADPDFVTAGFTLTATLAGSPGLEFEVEDPAEGIAGPLVGGSFDVEVVLGASFEFELDVSESDPDLAFALTNEPVVAVAVTTPSADTPLFGFQTSLGFSDVTVEGRVTLDLHLEAAFADPDGDGRITADEWSSTDIVDLVPSIAYLDGGTALDVDATLELDSTLLGPSIDATIHVTANDPVDALADVLAISYDWMSDFDELANVEATEVLSGLSVLAGALQGAQSFGDMPIPFIRDRISSAAMFALPVVEFVQRQGDAALICGSVDGDPPRGDLQNLFDGQFVFCQAVTLANPVGTPALPTGVEWSIDPADGVPVSGTTAPETVGTNPDGRAIFQMTAGTLEQPRSPRIVLRFTDAEGLEHEVERRFVSAQQLGDLLASLGGFDPGLAQPAYDPDTTALTFRLVAEHDPGPLSSALDFGDQLREATGITGLEPLAGASADIDPGPVGLDVVFGVLLEDGRDVSDRFFLQVRSGADEHEAWVSSPVGAFADATVELGGRVGFVEVTASGDASENPASSEAFEIRANEPGPLLALDFALPGIDLDGVGSPELPDAVLLRELLGDDLSVGTLADSYRATFNVRLTAGLRVSANVGDTTCQGGVFVEQVLDGVLSSADRSVLQSPPIFGVTSDFSEKLQPFDVSPALFGTHQGPAGAVDQSDDDDDTNDAVLVDTLVDPGGGFDAQLDKIQGLELENLDDGSRCIVQPSFRDAGDALVDPAVEATELHCLLSGGEENRWEPGDRYRLGGDPLALMQLILNGLEAVIDQVGGADHEAYNAKMPVVGVSPRELLSKLDDVREALDTFRSGMPEAVVRCTWDDGGSIAPVMTLAGLPDGGEIECWAVTGVDGSDLDSVSWSASGPGGGTVLGVPDLTTVASASGDNSSTARIQVNAVDPARGATLGTDFTVRAEITRTNGSRIVAELPRFEPTLQELERAFESNLGLEPEAVSFAVADLPPPGMASDPAEVQDLVVTLGYGRCTGAPLDCTGLSVEPPLELPLTLPLGDDVAGLVALEGSSTPLSLDYRAGGVLKVAFPLDPALGLGLDERLYVHRDSAIFVESRSTGSVELQANAGPLVVEAAGTAKFGAELALEVSGTDETFTIDGFAGALDMSFEGPSDLDCRYPAVGASQLTGSSGTDSAGESLELDGLDVDLRALHGLVGATVLNLTQGESCTVASVDSADELTCDLSNDAEWAANDDYEVEDVLSLRGDGCATLGLSFAGDELGTVGFRIADVETEPDPLASPEEWYASVPTDLLDKVSAEEIALGLLVEAVKEFLRQLGGALDSGEQVPLIGTNLAAGSDFASQTLAAFCTVVDALELIDETNVNGLEMAIEDVLRAELDAPASDVLADDAIDVNALCDDGGGGEEECPGTLEDFTQIIGVEVTLVLGEGKAPDPADPGCDPNAGDDCAVGGEMPFTTGLPGLPVRADGGLQANLGWRLPLTFGVTRKLGPYVATTSRSMDAPATPNGGTWLQLGASVGVMEAPAGQEALLCGEHAIDESVYPGLDGYAHDDGAPSRCFRGMIGFLEVNVRDGVDAGNDDHAPTRLALLAGMDLQSTGSSDRVPLHELFGSTQLAPYLDVDANVDLLFRSGVAGSVSEDLPAVVGTFHLSAGFSPSAPSGERVSYEPPRFDNLYVDTGGFIRNVVVDPVSEVLGVLKPFKPIIQVLRAPIPVVSDVAEMVGKPPVTLLSLLELVSENDLTLLRRILALADFLVTVAELGDGDSALVPLANPFPESVSASPGNAGGFEVDLETARQELSLPSQRGKLIDTSKAVVRKEVYREVQRQAGEGETFGVEGLTFPFLEDGSQIFGMLMGQDAVLVRYDAGTMQATAGFEYNYGPFAVGPVPVSVQLGGAVTIGGRFAMGYDTYGVRQMVESDDPDAGVVLGGVLDGIFIDDYDASGCDVPEIFLIGEVYAGASVDLVVAAAGLRGGLRYTTELNLADDDGRMRLDEIFTRIQNPVCLFDVSGRLEAFLGAWVRVGVGWFSVEWDIEFLRLVLLEFEIKCEPPPPDLATPAIHLGRPALLVNAGTRAAERRVFTDRTKEKVTVRQLTPVGPCPGEPGMECVTFGTTMFGIYQEDTLKDADLSDAFVVAHLADGDDTIGLLPGAMSEDGAEVPVAFTVAALITGGPGNDQIETGRGDDVVWGDDSGGEAGTDGNDRLNTGAGDDALIGGGGADVLAAEGGADVILAGSGNDQLIGGPGRDKLYGGAGSDNLIGGWAGSRRGPDDPALPSEPILGEDGLPLSDDDNPLLDKGDLLVGGAGSDVLQGGFGDDDLYGDFEADGGAGAPNDPELSSCDDGTGASEAGADQLSGGPGDDRLWGGHGRDALGGEGGDDFLCGGGASDLLHGDEADGPSPEDGNDVVFGGGGSDGLWGGRRHDRLLGGAGNDTLFGEAGQDQLVGGSGRDLLHGGSDNDVLVGDAGLQGAGGAFTVVAGDHGGATPPLASDPGLLGRIMRSDPPEVGEPLIADCRVPLDETSLPNHDALPGNADCLLGGDGHDVLIGGSGPDQLFGEDGRDYLEGNRSNDIVRGGRGDDVAYGHQRDGLLPADPGAWESPPPTASTLGAGETDADMVFGDSGDDLLFGGPDADLLRGGIGRDYVEGNQGDDVLFGDAGDDALTGGSSAAGTDDGADELTGNQGHDLLAGDNAVLVLRPDPRPAGSSLWRSRWMLDSLLDLETEGGADELDGSQGEDLLFGGRDDDLLRGGKGDDHLEGNPGDDRLFGDEGQDDLIGGTARGGGGVADGADCLFGGTNGGDDAAPPACLALASAVPLDGDHDVLLGDNGSVERTLDDSGDSWLADDLWAPEVTGLVRREVTLHDVATVDAPVLDAFSGSDQLFGEGGHDRLHGQGAADVLRGGPGPDLLEGNDNPVGPCPPFAPFAPCDTLYGDQGQDDLVGGTGRSVSGDPDTEDDGRLDGGDVLFGGDSLTDVSDDFDVLAGDNAVVLRTTGDPGPWERNSFNDSLRRWVLFLDVGEVLSPAEAEASGPDRLFGEGADDRMFGQGDDDEMLGGSGEDYMEGNAGSDLMRGGTGNDDMVGGTGRIRTKDGDDGPAGVDGRHDAGDVMYGDPGFDVMAGDNALLVRTLDMGEWVENSFSSSSRDPMPEFGIRHDPRILLDIDSPDADQVSGGDRMHGDDGAGGADHDDLMYGQGGSDRMFGGAGDDFMEGNANGSDAGDLQDILWGEPGQDDMIGGTVEASRGDGGDDMAGNEDADVMAGDNATIERPVDGTGQWIIDPNTGDFVRRVVLLDVELVGGASCSSCSGSDFMSGNQEQDQLFGQGGNDHMNGNEDFDYMEGNHGRDTMYGGGGEDDLIGGGSARDGVIRRDSIGDGLRDMEDIIHGDDGDSDPSTGGDDGDVIAGDNARLTRDLVWRVDPNVDDVLRTVQLFDVERVGGGSVAPATSGSDQLFGEGGRDLMFGQGNSDADDADGDGRFSEDPPDGVDNDHDGRESLGSLGYDCEDGSDNDGDGLVDGDDPDCAAAVDEDGGGDLMRGGAGPDVMEGNHGGDWMFGDDGEDDMIGGSSAGDGLVGGGVPPLDLADADDVMHGGGDDDVLAGDNAVIERPVDGFGLWLKHFGFGFDLAVRELVMEPVLEAEGAFGHDYQQGNGGHDDMYGQRGNDYMEGNSGEDAMVGDLGLITNTLEDGSREETISSRGPFFEELIYPAGRFTRGVELLLFLEGEGAEGHDTMLGMDGDDSLHGGPGADLLNGDGDGHPDTGEDPDPATADEDRVFGDDGDDVLWGGRGHDHGWGGWGDDHLDVRPREETETTPADPPEWFTWGRPDHYQDLDIHYGGWDRDALQADIHAPGPVDADRLIDWAGAFNVFYVCGPSYGEGTITRQGSPHLKRFLEDLIEADGALRPRQRGSSGFQELAYVHANERGRNSHPPHPDHPGHFTCDDGTVPGPDDQGGGNGKGKGPK